MLILWFLVTALADSTNTVIAANLPPPPRQYEIIPNEPWYGIYVTPGPGMPTLEERNITVSDIYYSLNTTVEDFEIYTAYMSQPAEPDNHSRPLRRRGIVQAVTNPNCLPDVVDPDYPQMLALYAITYLGSLASLTTENNSTTSEYEQQWTYAPCEVRRDETQKMWAQASDNFGHVITLVGESSDWENDRRTTCGNVAYLAYRMLDECSRIVWPADHDQTVVSGEAVELDGGDHKFKVRVVRDNPLL